MQIINYPIHADGHVSGKIRFFFTKKPGVLPLPARDKALFFQKCFALETGLCKTFSEKCRTAYAKASADSTV